MNTPTTNQFQCALLAWRELCNKYTDLEPLGRKFATFQAFHEATVTWALETALHGCKLPSVTDTLENVNPRLTIPAEVKPEASEIDGLKALNKLFVEADLIMNPKFDEYYKTIRAAISRAMGATS